MEPNHHNNIIKIKLVNLFIFLFGFFALIWVIYVFFYGFSELINNISAVYSVLISILMCYIYRHNIGFFITMFFLAYTNYSIAFGVYLFPSIRPNHIYYQFTNIDTYGNAILCILIFEAVLLLLSQRVIKNPEMVKLEKKSVNYVGDNAIIANLCIFLYLLVFFTNFRFSQSGGRATLSPLLEYRNLFFIIGFCYSGGKKYIKILWIIVISVTAVLTLMGGNRADIFASITLLVCFYFYDRLNYKHVLYLMPVAIVIFATVGFIRGGISLLAMKNAVQTLWESKMTYEGATYAYGASISMIELTSIISNKEKIDLLINHIVYAFTLGSGGNINPDLARFSRQYYFHNFGFVSPLYFFVWVKLFSGVILAFLIKGYANLYKYITVIHKSSFDKLKVMLFYFFIANFARWYTYGPMALFRGAFLAGLLFILAEVIDIVTKRKGLVDTIIFRREG